MKDSNPRRAVCRTAVLAAELIDEIIREWPILLADILRWQVDNLCTSLTKMASYAGLEPATTHGQCIKIPIQQ